MLTKLALRIGHIISLNLQWVDQQSQLTDLSWVPGYYKFSMCFERGQGIGSTSKRMMHQVPPFAELVEIWKDWHLNDMKAGCDIQEDFLKEYKNDRYNYNEVIEALEKRGIRTVNVILPEPIFIGALGYKPTEVCRTHTHYETYTYGTKWLVKRIPDDSIQKIIHYCQCIINNYPGIDAELHTKYED